MDLNADSGLSINLFNPRGDLADCGRFRPIDPGFPARWKRCGMTGPVVGRLVWIGLDARERCKGRWKPQECL